MPGAGFEIADAYVTIHAKVDDAAVEATAHQIAEDLDTGVASDFQGTRIAQEFEKAGSNSGTSFRSKAHTEVDKLGQDMESDTGGLFSSISGAFEKAGMQAGDLFSNGIVDGAKNAFKVFTELPPEAQAAVAAAATVIVGTLAPAILSALNAALLGAVGGLGLAAGIIAEAHDPAVAAAFSGLKTDLTGELKAAASSFIDPLVAASGTISNAFAASGPALTHFFDELAPSIDRLANGLGIVVSLISKGLADSGGAASLVLNAIADSLPIIGASIEMFFEEIQLGGSGAADIIRVLAVGIGGIIIALGAGIGLGSVIFEGIMKGASTALLPVELLLKAISGLPVIGGAAKDALNAIENVLGGGATKSKDAAAGMGLFGSATTAAGQSAATADKAITDLFNDINKTLNASLAAVTAADKYKTSLAQLGTAAQQNGHSLDANTAAGEANRQAFESVAAQALSAAQAVRDNAVAQGQSGVQAAHAYSSALAGNISQLASSAQQAGFNKGQIAQMISTMFGIPLDIATEFATPGSAAAKKAAQDLEYALEAIQTKIDIDIYLHQHGVDPTGGGVAGDVNHGFALGGIHRAATGLIAGATTTTAGIYADGPLTMFAEPSTVQEAYIPMVTPDPARRLAVLAEAASWAGLSLVPTGAGSSPSQTVQPATSAPAAPPTVNQYFGYDPGAERSADMRRQAQMALAVTR